MKKVLGMLMVLAMLLTMSVGALATEEPIEVGVVWQHYDEFLTGFRLLMDQKAEEMGGFSLTVTEAEGDQVKFFERVDAMITRGIQNLALNPCNSTMSIELTEKCKEAGLNVVYFNMEPMAEALEAYENQWYVGTLAADSGTMSAEMLIDYLKENGEAADHNGDGVFQIIIIRGIIGHGEAEARAQAFEDALAASGLNYEIVKYDTADHEKALALDMMTTYITELGLEGIDGVLCGNDAMAMGAMQAVMNAGWNSGNPDEYIPITGIDATVEALEAIRTGSMEGTVLNDREKQSEAVLKTIQLANAGTEITEESLGMEGVTVDGRYIWVPYEKVTDDNYADILETLANLN